MLHHLATFLGISDYEECSYVAEPDFNYTSPFSSHAISSLILKQYGAPLKVTVFLTKGAGVANKERFQQECPIPSDQLHFVEIPEQADEVSYWQIFQVINSAIEDDETVWLDITNSFRYLPMLGYAVVQYLETVRKISIGGIYYGAAEVLDQQKEGVGAVGGRRMPLRNLTPFLHVNRWTSALREFNQSGSAKSIRELTDEKALPLLKASRGKDDQAQALRKLGNALDTWTRQVQTCRGREIQNSNIGENVTKFVKGIDAQMIPALSSEFIKLSNIFERYRSGQIQNIFFAVEWCIEHGLTQQAWTLLQEGIVTYFTELWGRDFGDFFSGAKDQKEDMGQERSLARQREFVSQILNISGRNIHPSDWKSPVSDSPKLAGHLLNQLPAELSKLFVNLSASRNDINHGGFRESASDYKKLAERAVVALQETKKYLPRAFNRSSDKD